MEEIGSFSKSLWINKCSRLLGWPLSDSMICYDMNAMIYNSISLSILALQWPPHCIPCSSPHRRKKIEVMKRCLNDQRRPLSFAASGVPWNRRMHEEPPPKWPSTPTLFSCTAVARSSIFSFRCLFVCYSLSSSPELCRSTQMIVQFLSPSLKAV